MVHKIKAPVTGTVWVHSVGVGATVSEGMTVMVLESMKMEVPVESPCNGVVKELLPEGTQIAADETIVAEIDDAQ